MEPKASVPQKAEDIERNYKSISQYFYEGKILREEFRILNEGFRRNRPASEL
jgi:hypothetical protein